MDPSLLSMREGNDLEGVLSVLGKNLQHVAFISG